MLHCSRNFTSMYPREAKHASYNRATCHTYSCKCMLSLNFTCMHDVTVLTIVTMAAAVVVYAVLTDSEEEEDEEPTIKCPDRGWLKRRQEFLNEFPKGTGLKISLLLESLSRLM